MDQGPYALCAGGRWRRSARILKNARCVPKPSRRERPTSPLPFGGPFPPPPLRNPKSLMLRPSPHGLLQYLHSSQVLLLTISSNPYTNNSFVMSLHLASPPHRRQFVSRPTGPFVAPFLPGMPAPIWHVQRNSKFAAVCDGMVESPSRSPCRAWLQTRIF